MLYVETILRIEYEAFTIEEIITQNRLMDMLWLPANQSPDSNSTDTGLFRFD
jgi:hypothetical protein